MVLEFEELRVLKAAEVVADGIWKGVARWETFAREVVGVQMARAADSIGANIAEAYGRFHYGEKLQFLYYARGSLFETKYWLNRAQKRDLMPAGQTIDYASQLTDLARQLNAFAADLKKQRRGGSRTIRETTSEYAFDGLTDLALFTEADLEWFETTSNIQYPITNIHSEGGNE
jgi:four helix bundle protein